MASGKTRRHETRKNWFVKSRTMGYGPGRESTSCSKSRDGWTEVGDDAMAPPPDDVGDPALPLSAVVD